MASQYGKRRVGYNTSQADLHFLKAVYGGIGKFIQERIAVG